MDTNTAQNRVEAESEERIDELKTEPERYSRRAYEIDQAFSEREKSIAAEVNQNFEDIQTVILNELGTISSQINQMQAELNQVLSTNLDTLQQEQDSASGSEVDDR